ncbi:MAG: hypothetical protein WCL08_00105 [Verrucomicrobiota bacterium]
MSAFLTSDRSVCFHEGIKFVPNDRSYTKFFADFGRPAAGDAGAHIAFIYRDLAMQFPRAKFVIIKRPVQQCVRSGMKIGLTQADVLKSCEALVDMEKNCNHVCVDFTDIFKPKGAKLIWEQCIGEPFDALRFEVLRRLNIQATESTHEETRRFVSKSVAIPLGIV